jgi:hypothetical protein
VKDRGGGIRIGQTTSGAILLSGQAVRVVNQPLRSRAVTGRSGRRTNFAIGLYRRRIDCECDYTDISC